MRHENGPVEILERSQDTVISGGENVSGIEDEDVRYPHPAGCEAALVALPRVKWGTSRCSFIAPKDGTIGTKHEKVKFCHANMARFKAPGSAVFVPVPRSSTREIHQFILREQAKAS